MPFLTKNFLKIEARRGKASEFSLLHKFGRNDNVPFNSFAFVNLLGFTDWPLSAPTPVRIKAGGDVADTALGLGAREVTVQGINTSFNEVTEVIVPAGVSASLPTTTSWWRIHRAFVSVCGTYGDANVGVVTIENAAGGTDLIAIDPGDGQSQFAGWTVPLATSAFLLSATICVDSKKSADIRVYTREGIDITVPPVPAKRLRLFFAGVSGDLAYRPRTPLGPLSAKSDIWWEARGDGATTSVSVEFELLIVDD